MLDAERTALERFLTAGVDEETYHRIGDLPRGRGVLGVLISDPKPLRLAEVGAHPRSYGFPAGHPVMKTFLGVPVMLGGRAWGNLYLAEKAGGKEFDEGDEEAAVVLADWAAVAIANARVYGESQARRADLERAVAGLEATTAIARAVGSETELQRVLELIVKRGRALVEARAMVLLLAEGDMLALAACAGQVDPQAARCAHPVRRHGRRGRPDAGRPERIGDVETRLALEEERLGVVGAETALLVPLVYRGAPQGVLAAFDRLAPEAGFGADEEALMLAFAASAATAVATAKTVERERLRESLASAERERRRWARELHDETLQALGGLRMMLSSAARRGDPERLASAVGEAVGLLDSEIGGLRRLIADLRPAALDELGLVEAIDGLRTRVAAQEGIEIEIEADLGGERLAPGARDRRLPHRPGGADQRGQARRRPRACASSSAATTTGSTWRSPTTAAASSPAPRAPASAWSGSPSGPSCSAVRSPWTPRRPAPRCGWRSPCATPGHQAATSGRSAGSEP